MERGILSSPGSCEDHVLSCSARPNSCSRHVDAEQLGMPIPIPPFSQEGRDLLSLRSGRGQSSDGASDTKELIDALGGLPLGLDQAAAFMRVTNLGYSQFLKKFQEAQEILLDENLPEFWEYKKAVQENRAEPEQRQKIGIQTTWKMSFDYLENRPNGPSKCHLLTLSAYLDSKSISQALFTPWSKLVDCASSKRIASNESSLESSTSNRTEESVLAYTASWARPLLQDLDQNSRAFLKFIQDAYKIGLVSSTRHDDTRGILYPIHPLVSRWLRSSHDKGHILEAAFLTFHLVRDLDKIPNITDLHYEADRHILACVNLNDDLPEHLRLGIGDPRQVSLEFCSFVIDEYSSSEAQFNILRAALSSEEGGSHLLQADGFPDWIILGRMADAKKEMGDYDEAKDLLLRAKSRTPVSMTKFYACLIEDLIFVYVKQQDEHSLQWVYKDLVDGIEYLYLWRKNDEQLNPYNWISHFHQSTCTFCPQYDLSVLALANFLKLLDQQLPIEESEKLTTIRLIAEYYLGLSYFGAAQFGKRQNSFLSLLRKTAGLTYSDSVLFLEVGSRFFNGVTQYLVEGKDAADVPSETMQQISRTRPMDSNRAILEEIERALKFSIKILPDSSDSFWKVNLLLRNIIVPRWQLDGAAHDTSLKEFTNLQDISARISSAIITSTLQPKILQEAEASSKSYIELLGHCEATETLQCFVPAGHWMFRDFEKCLCIHLEQVHHTVAVGQASGSNDIRSIGRCFIWLGKLDDLEKHKQQYPNEDWDQLQEEEENRIMHEGHSSTTKESLTVRAQRRL